MRLKQLQLNRTTGRATCVGDVSHLYVVVIESRRRAPAQVRTMRSSGSDGCDGGVRNSLCIIIFSFWFLFISGKRGGGWVLFEETLFHCPCVLKKEIIDR